MPTPKDVRESLSKATESEEIESKETETPAQEPVSDPNETYIRKLNGDRVTSADYAKDPD